ncbi:MAG: class I SAM-dependent RNA methyltransferase, partial [Micrococcales bacterium]|nr:class I SAM-dependent RNA methyltransferase [Micrococcales bacterium]
DGQVVAVEADRDAVARATADLAGRGNVVVLGARVDDAFGLPRTDRRRGRAGGPGRRRPTRSPLLPQRADVVVLDPPRTGAGVAVVGAVTDLRPRAVAYVACDPAALARDTAALLERGYRLEALRAFDAFPMTHHVECVAHFVPDAG